MNVIYIVAIDHPTSVHKCSDYSQFCINTWKYYCDKNNIDLKVIDVNDERFGKPIWNKHSCPDGDKYEKIGIIDSDTMIKWDAPNLFDLFDDDYCGVIDSSNYRWIHDSAKVYGKFFPNITIDYDYYINGGVLMFSKKYLDISNQLLDFYLSNKQELDNWNKGGGKEQTLLNYHLIKNNIRPKILDPSWNLLAIHKKEMFRHNWQLNEDDTPLFVKYGNIWHFTGFPVTDRIKIMKQVWTKYRGYYG